MGFFVVGRFSDCKIPDDCAFICGSWDSLWFRSISGLVSCSQMVSCVLPCKRAKLVGCGEQIVVIVEENGLVVWIRRWNDAEFFKFLLDDVAVDVRCGQAHCLVLLADGSVLGAGSNLFGQLGLGTVSEYEPLKFVLGGVRAIACGTLHSVCVMEQSGKALISGWNNYGQGGGGICEQRQISSFLHVQCEEQGFVMAACGLFHTLLLRADGRVEGLGYNSHGQLDDVDELEGVVAVEAGARHSVFLLHGGRVVIKGFRSEPVEQVGKSIRAFGWTTIIET